jgi:hypothetical protein
LIEGRSAKTPAFIFRVQDTAFGAQVDPADIAIDDDPVAGIGVPGDPFRLDHHRYRQGAGDDRRMAGQRALLKYQGDDLAGVLHQLAGADVAGHQHGVLGQLGRIVRADQVAQQPVRQVVKVVQTLANIGVGDPLHPGARVRLDLLDRHLGRQSGFDRLVQPAPPALVIGEHAVGLEDLAMLAAGAQAVALDQPVDIAAQRLHGLGQTRALDLGIVGDRVEHHQPRLVQMHHPLGDTVTARDALEHHWPNPAPRPGGQPVRAQERPRLGHLRDHHGDDLQRLDLVLGIVAPGLVLDHQHTHHLAQPLDRHADERVVDFLAGLRQVAKTGRGLGVIGDERLGPFGDAPDQALTDAQPGRVDRVLPQTLGGAKLQRALVALQIDRAHLGDHVVGHQMHHLVEPLLTVARPGHDSPKRAQQCSRSTLVGGHVLPSPISSIYLMRPQALSRPNVLCSA